jgi:hypothetical protein
MNMDIIYSLISHSDIDVNSIVNIKLVFGLLAIGWIIKHVKYLAKLPNDFIPIILIIVSLIVNFLNADGTTPGDYANSFVSAILSASVAIGMHQQGKGVFKSLKSAASSAIDSLQVDADDKS